MIRIHSHSPLIIIGLTAYYLIRNVSDGDTSSSVCKYTNFLNTSKQNTRKLTDMWRNTTNAPEKNQSSPRRLAFAATYPSPAIVNEVHARYPSPAMCVPAVRLAPWCFSMVYIAPKNKKYAGPLMGRAYLFNRATGGAVASLP